MERQSEQFGSNNLPLFFQAMQLVVDTKLVVSDAPDHPANVWLGGESPCVGRIIGIARLHKLARYAMRLAGTLMPVFGWAKMWSGRLSGFMRNGHPAC